MGRLIPVTFLIYVLFIAAALISCLAAEKPEIRRLPRGVWVVLIVLVPVLGPVLYFLYGRPVPARRTTPWQPPSLGRPGPARPARPVAPEDDAEFLRSLENDSIFSSEMDAEATRRQQEQRRRAEQARRERAERAERDQNQRPDRQKDQPEDQSEA